MIGELPSDPDFFPPLFTARIINALEILDTKRDQDPAKKRGNIPQVTEK